MSISNRERVGRAFELLAAGLEPYVEGELHAVVGEKWWELAQTRLDRDRGLKLSPSDPQVQLRLLAEFWQPVFGRVLGRAERNLVFELQDVRNRWAHNERFTADDAYRALDSIERLLIAVSAPEATDVTHAKQDVLRLRYEQEARKATPAETPATASVTGLRPWREVITPHHDVATGRFQQAEFAADLAQVRRGEGALEYRDPVEFFRRTYLTQGLRDLLLQAAQRVTGSGGVPVVNLQTNFGGGKTHSLLALHHLLSGIEPAALPQEVQDLLRSADIDTLPPVQRAVLVGTALRPGQPSTKPDGTVVRTLWGELAWQLGGPDGYKLVAKADETGTNPGDALVELFRRHTPCLVLIDEWVAYARQLYSRDDLPAGTFDVHFTFAQALTEASRAAPGVLTVISIPASEPRREASSEGDGTTDVEVGGVGGREALRRLRNAVGRMESSWRPASAEESFEIVRRRLFEPIDPHNLPHRDATARVFADYYRAQNAEFPAECREPAYAERIKAAYPIHPELFARLYGDWSTLDRFQRTRGVLRLMAAVVHALWQRNDQAPLILPASLPLDDTAVLAEVTRHLEDNWKPIIDADVDGPASLPVAVDRDLPNLGRYSAARRVARTVFLGSAPTLRSAHRGVEGRDGQAAHVVRRHRGFDAAGAGTPPNRGDELRARVGDEPCDQRQAGVRVRATVEQNRATGMQHQQPGGTVPRRGHRTDADEPEPKTSRCFLPRPGCLVEHSGARLAAGGHGGRRTLRRRGRRIQVPAVELVAESPVRWRIPATGAMRGIVFASADLLPRPGDEALAQIVNVATLPGVVEASYAMPDVHWGYGFPIGGVAATDVDAAGVVSPGGVGFDISCGVRMLVTDLDGERARRALPEIADGLDRTIPRGMGGGAAWKLRDRGELVALLRDGSRAAVAAGYGTERDLERCEDFGAVDDAAPEALSERAYQRGLGQVGSLGSGNHFLEVQEVDAVYDAVAADAFGLASGALVVMIHCGSRGLGHQVCTDYVHRMLAAMPRYGIDVPDRQLACAPVDSAEGRDYLAAMAAAANYGRANRHVLGHAVRRIVQRVVPGSRVELLYDVSHNLAKLETHEIAGEQRRVLVHRKGATRAFPPGH